ncbi:MAG: hypothetical protein KF858_05915 [Candidatus Sumerlaeia bacterium]|nr:hypothetical protein [Candidatus Sumerlaeia bacterium]
MMRPLDEPVTSDASPSHAGEWFVRRLIGRFVALVAVGAVLFLYYCWRAKPTVSIDSMIYLALPFLDPFHPHHLFWAPLLFAGRAVVARLLPELGPIESGQMVLAVLTAVGMMVFAVMLHRLARMRLAPALLWALVLGTSGTITSLASETEAYNGAMAFYLASLALLAPIEGASRGIQRLRVVACMAAFCAAVLLHQKFCLGVLPIALWYWRSEPPSGRRRGAAFVAVSGALCLVAYLIVWRLAAPDRGLVDWMTRYHGEFTGIFGLVQNFVSWEGIRLLADNFGSALVYYPAHHYRIPLAVTISLLALTYLGAIAGILRRDSFATLAGVWFLLFETFLWWWAPSLRQMQSLSFPPALMVWVWWIEQGRLALGARLGERRAAAAAILLPAALALFLVVGNRDIRDRVIHVRSMDEARWFFYTQDARPDDESFQLLMYEYSHTLSYQIALGWNARHRVTMISDKPGSIPEAAERLTDHLRRPDARLFVHQSISILANGDAWQRLVADVELRSGRAISTQPVRLVIGPDDQVLGFWWTPDGPTPGEGPVLPFDEAVIRALLDNDAPHDVHLQTWRVLDDALERLAPFDAQLAYDRWQVIDSNHVALEVTDPGLIAGFTTGDDPFVVLAPVDPADGFTLARTPVVSFQLRLDGAERSPVPLELYWPNRTGRFLPSIRARMPVVADGSFQTVARDFSRQPQWALRDQTFDRLRLDLGDEPGVRFTLEGLRAGGVPRP